MPGRGFIYGYKKLNELFGKKVLDKLSYLLGKIMSQIIIKAKIRPVDVEVVIKRSKEFGITPAVIDFNEASLISELNLSTEKAKITSIILALKDRNGKQIFPRPKFLDTKNPNPTYAPFKKGFLEDLSGKI